MRFLRGVYGVEQGLVAVLLLLMALIPVVEFIGRRGFDRGIPGATDYLQHLTLWVGFLGAVLTSREGKHLRIGGALELMKPRMRAVVHAWTGFVAACVCWALCGASIQLVVAEAPGLRESAAEVLPGVLLRWLEPFGLFEAGASMAVAGWMPVWVAELIMPLAFGFMAVRFCLGASEKVWGKAMAFLSLPLSIALGLFVEMLPGVLLGPGIILLVVSAILGAPIFILLGGAAVLLFWADGVTIAAIPAETYRIVTNPVFPTIPIFTLAGFILSESRASERLVKVFRALFGWIPGGSAVAVTILCAFFTTFTGASGITILALGGLLLPVLIGSGFRERFSVGLLTATGSLGLLFPPSLVVILYGVIAHVPIVDVFKAGLLPGALLVLPICAICVVRGIRDGVKRTPFEGKKALLAVWAAKWELLIPVVALVAIFGGFCTLVEAAALTVVYSLIVEMLIYRDLRAGDLLSLLTKSAVLLGGVLIILGVAMGLTSYVVDAQLPMQAADWAKQHLQSRWLFLLALNGALILVGCLMDIYSALVVVVPLILPMAAAFGVNPVHLGIIFLANLQLGYLTPPVGMNLFLAAFRFDRPLLRVARYALPFLFVLLAVVLLITYVPWLSVGMLELLSQ